VFNDLDQIVITNPSPAINGPGVGTSYLIPQPGTRLDLATLVANLPAGFSLTNVAAIDDLGELTGTATDASCTFTTFRCNSYPFLLVPLADGELCGEVEPQGARILKQVIQTIQQFRRK
jgi:hypothetical protein